jgi:hypothetical protein
MNECNFFQEWVEECLVECLMEWEVRIMAIINHGAGKRDRRFLLLTN